MIGVVSGVFGILGGLFAKGLEKVFPSKDNQVANDRFELIALNLALFGGFFDVIGGLYVWSHWYNGTLEW